MKKIILFLVLGIYQFYNAQQIISSNTTWSGNVFLSQKVIVNEGVTLNIEAGTLVQIAYVDSDGDNIGDVEIEVNGELIVNGTLGCSSVIFSPVVSSNDKKYWNGISINSKQLTTINGVEIYNANFGIRINSNSSINSSIIKNFNDVGIYCSPKIKNSTIKLNSITLSNGGTGILCDVDSSAIYTKSCIIDSCNNGVINAFSNFQLSNSKISHCKRIAVSTEDGKMEINNCLINGNYSFGIINSSSELKVSKSTIKDNYLGGVIIAGFAKNNIQNSSIINNIGSQFEITDYKILIGKNSSNAIYEGAPSIVVENNNIYGDTTKIAIDSLNLFPIIQSDFDYDLYGIGINEYPKNINLLGFTPITGRLNYFKTDVQVRNIRISSKNNAVINVTWKNDYEIISSRKFSIAASAYDGGTDVGEIGLNNFYHNNRLFYINISNEGYNNLLLYGFPHNIKYQYSFGGKYISSNVLNTDSIYNFRNNNFNTLFPLKYFYDFSKKSINYTGYKITTIVNSNVDEQLLARPQGIYLRTTNDSDTLCNSSKLIAPNVSGASYNWYLNGNLFKTTSLNEYSPIVAGFWHAVITSSSCNIQTIARNIVISNGPTLSISGEKAICLGKSTTLTVSGADSYVWNNNSTLNSITLSPTTNTAYSVKGFKNGCSSTINVSVTVNPLPIVTLNPYPSVIMCKGSTTKLISSDGVSYLWNTGGVTKSIDVTTEGVYNVKVTDKNGCSAVSQNTTVVFSTNTIETPVITSSNSVCVGSTIDLTATENGGTWHSSNDSKARISNGTVTGVAAGTSLITYSVCNTETTKLITIETAPIVTLSGPSKICWNGRAMFRASVAGGVWAPIDNTLLLASPQGLFRNSVKPATDNYKSGVSYTVSSKLGACSTKATKNVYVRNVIAPSITISTLKSSIKVNESTTATATTNIVATGTWSSTNTLVSAIANTLNTKTATVKGLRVGSGANVVYFADDATTGCRNAGYLAYSVTAAASMVSVSTNSETATSNTSLYPNPSNGKFTIENTEGATTVKLLDLTGRVIATQPIFNGTATIDFSDVATGKYVVQIAGETTNEVHPIVIE